jgi:antitoxin VapB
VGERKQAAAQHAIYASGAGRSTRRRSSGLNDAVEPCRNIVTALCISQLDIQGNGAMASSTVFISNRSQAVRLPKAVAFPEDVHQVDILKIGRSRVIVPQGKRWDDLFENGPRVSGDFMSEGAQPAAEEREPL